jgi:hypothetical protein
VLLFTLTITCRQKRRVGLRGVYQVLFNVQQQDHSANKERLFRVIIRLAFLCLGCVSVKLNEQMLIGSSLIGPTRIMTTCWTARRSRFYLNCFPVSLPGSRSGVYSTDMSERTGSPRSSLLAFFNNSNYAMSTFEMPCY